MGLRIATSKVFTVLDVIKVETTFKIISNMIFGIFWNRPKITAASYSLAFHPSHDFYFSSLFDNFVIFHAIRFVPPAKLLKVTHQVRQTLLILYALLLYILDVFISDQMQEARCEFLLFDESSPGKCILIRSKICEIEFHQIFRKDVFEGNFWFGSLHPT